MWSRLRTKRALLYLVALSFAVLSTGFLLRGSNERWVVNGVEDRIDVADPALPPSTESRVIVIPTPSPLKTPETLVVTQSPLSRLTTHSPEAPRKTESPVSNTQGPTTKPVENETNHSEDTAQWSSTANPYEKFLPIGRKLFPKRPRGGLIEENGWDFNFGPDCAPWKICNATPCNLNRSTSVMRPPIHYPNRTLLDGDLGSVANFIQKTLEVAWGDQPPSIDLYLRTGCREQNILIYLLESIYLFWPRDLGSIVIVLDENDRGFADVVVPEFYREFHTFRIIYERIPCISGRLFNQYSYLNLHKYINSDYVVTIDTDCVFTMPVTPDLLFSAGGKLLLPTSMAFQADYAWDPMQKFFTAISHAPSGHPMITQPVNFHVNSTFEPFRTWIIQKRGKCYEDLLTEYIRVTKDVYFFCWMCQLKTFLENTTVHEYNILNVDVLIRDPVVRYAIHVKHEHQQFAKASYAESYKLTVQSLIRAGICRYLQRLNITSPTDCPELRTNDQLFLYNFFYAYIDLMPRVPQKARLDKVLELVDRFTSAASRLLPAHA